MIELKKVKTGDIIAVYSSWGVTYAKVAETTRETVTTKGTDKCAVHQGASYRREDGWHVDSIKEFAVPTEGLRKLSELEEIRKRIAKIRDL
jgi:hypothetical protein